MRLQIGDQLAGALGRETAQRRRRMQQAGQLHHVEIRVQQLAANAGGQMPHGAGTEQRRAAGHAQAGAQRRQVPTDVVDHQLVFVFVFGRAHQALAAEAILLRIVLTARRARQRVGVDLAALLADQQFRASADQHAAIGQWQGKVVTGRVLHHQVIEDLVARHRLLQLDVEDARQHRLVQLALFKAADRFRHRVLEARLVRNAGAGGQAMRLLQHRARGAGKAVVGDKLITFRHI